MAKKNEILLSIAVDGDAESKRKIKEVFDEAKRSNEDISKRLGGAGKGLQASVSGLQEALAPLTQSTGLGGLLGAAGLGGILGRFAAGPAGILAGITSALVGLAKIGESSDRARDRLAALGDAKGFERLTQQAKQLGTSVSNLQPGAEQNRTFQQRTNAQNTSVVHPPGFQPGALEESAAGVRVFSGGQQLTPPSTEALTRFDSALFKQIRRDVESNDEAARIKDEFKKSLFSGGLTPDLVRSLPPNAGKFLASQLSKPLGQNFENPEELAAAIERRQVRPADLNATSVVNAVSRPNAEFDKAADGARGLTQAFEALTGAVGRLLDRLGGDKAGIGKGIDKATGVVEQGGALLDQMAKNRAETGPKTLDEVVNGTKGDLLGRFTGYVRNQIGGADTAAGAATGGIVSQITTALQQLFSGNYFNKDNLPLRPGGGTFGSEVLPPRPPTDQGGEPAVFTDGRRYSRQLNPGQSDSGVQDATSNFVSAVNEAAQQIRNTTGVPNTAQGRAGGGPIGYVRGPGSTTSDSIPAWMSDKEYVVKAESTSKVGLAALDYINEHGELPGYAAGGQVSPLGSLEVTPLDDGGAIINGNYVPPGSAILDDPRVKQALAQARASRGSSGEGKKHKSDFVGLFGGHNFDTPGSYARGGAIGRISRYGMSRGFAEGGLVDVPDLVGAAPSVGAASSGSSWPDVEHLGSMDLHHPAGDARVIGPKQTLRNMAAAARDSADARTGRMPEWYYGR